MANQNIMHLAFLPLMILLDFVLYASIPQHTLCYDSSINVLLLDIKLFLAIDLGLPLSDSADPPAPKPLET